jgi:hypothetical protein
MDDSEVRSEIETVNIRLQGIVLMLRRSLSVIGSIHMRTSRSRRATEG